MTDAIAATHAELRAAERRIDVLVSENVRLKTAIHGGNAINSTAQLLEELAPLAPTDEMQRACRERAAILRNALST